jgi:ubiquinone/menaquinone biosynthesis C-methylase UbiE
MSKTSLFDEERSNHILRMYRTSDVAHRRREAIDAIDPQPGERILDVGAGPAVFASELAVRVASDGQVVGIDASDEMLELGRRSTAASPHGDLVDLRKGDATALPVEDGGFDAAVAVQVLEYVSDIGVALREIHRALRVGGRVLVWDTDWKGLMWHSTDPDRMRQILEAWDTHLVHPTLNRRLVPALRDAGFAIRRVSPYCLLNLEATIDTYSGGLIGLIESFMREHAGSDGLDIDGWASELRTMSDAGTYFFCIPAVHFLAVKEA